MGGSCTCCVHDYLVWYRHLLWFKKFVCLWFMYCYLLFLLLLDCWFCDIFLTFLDAGFWRTTNSRDPSLPRCPRFQISRPCKLPGTFLYPWLFTSFMIAGHIGWFFCSVYFTYLCALLCIPNEFPFVMLFSHLCCLGTEMLICSFGTGI